MKFRWNKKWFTPLNVINEKTPPYLRNGVLRHYNYIPYPRLGQGVVAVTIIPYSCRACTTQLSLPWDNKIKNACNQSRYRRVFNCEYYTMIES